MLKNRKHIVILIFALLACQSVVAATHNDTVMVQINGTDTFFLAYLHEIYVFPKMHFKSKKQEKFYWRTVRDVKKTYPIACELSKEMVRVDAVMANMTKKERHSFWKQYEKVLYKRYEDQFRHMTAGQGQMLMKLIDRQSGQTSFNVIKKYKGSFVAGFWQGIAKMFGNNLKENYDGSDKDQITERIILLVEAGQL